MHKILRAAPTMEGEGMRVNRAFPTHEAAAPDPFLLLDQLGPHTHGPGEAKGAPDHPHRGFETVTYVIEGALEHEDSQGHAGRIEPGGVQWMTAGDGVVHSEMPAKDIREKGGTVHGFQLWINLPAKDKRTQPRYQELSKEEIPKALVDGGDVAVLAGAYGGVKGPVEARIPITYLHARLDQGAALEFESPGEQHGFLFVARGSVDVDGQRVEQSAYVRVGFGVKLRVQATEAADLLFVTGKPIREPVVQWGPFVMNTREEIVEAVRDYQSGKFGQITARVN